MSPSRRRSMRATAVAAGLLLAISLSPTQSAGAAEKDDRRLTQKARSHGVTSEHGAYVGWSTPGSKATGGTANDTPITAQATVSGIDVCGHQGNVDWAALVEPGQAVRLRQGDRGHLLPEQPYFAQQYNGSYNLGLIRGAYHFASPTDSSGAAQANYFVNNGGGWSADGKTLPGRAGHRVQPVRRAPATACSQAAMRSWIADFLQPLQGPHRPRRGRSTRPPDWWTTSAPATPRASRSTNPLWIARYASAPGTLPGGWGFYTFWQYTSSPMDQNTFNGAYDRLQALARG